MGPSAPEFQGFRVLRLGEVTQFSLEEESVEETFDQGLALREVGGESKNVRSFHLSEKKYLGTSQKLRFEAHLSTIGACPGSQVGTPRAANSGLMRIPEKKFDFTPPLEPPSSFIVTTSKALVTSSDALVTTSFLLLLVMC